MCCRDGKKEGRREIDVVFVSFLRDLRLRTHLPVEECSENEVLDQEPEVHSADKLSQQEPPSLRLPNLVHRRNVSSRSDEVVGEGEGHKGHDEGGNAR